MDSIYQHETVNPYRSGGGSHTIALGVRYQDADDPEYEHALVWKFEPTFATDSQTPMLESRGFLHKQYWVENRDEIEYTHYSTDDGSNLVESYGWFDTIAVSSVPEQVWGEMEALFGSEVRTNTFETPVGGADAVMPTVSVPTEAEAFVAELELKVDARASEEIDEDDPRVTPDDFTSHVRDGDTGEILSTSHFVSHDCSWWIQPVRNGSEPYLRIEKCFHKTWDEGMVGSFECEYENEEVVEAYRSADEAPSFDSLPEDVIASLSNWLGEPIVKRSLERCGAEMPQRVYECFECDATTVATPRGTCVECGSESLCTYKSIEQYEESKANESETTKKIKEMLASAEPSVSVDE